MEATKWSELNSDAMKSVLGKLIQTVAFQTTHCLN